MHTKSNPKLALKVSDPIRSLQVQLVLYNNELPALKRVVSAIAASCKVARRLTALTDVHLSIGDCSPGAVFGASEWRTLEAEVLGSHVSASYQHFGENLGSAGGSNRLAADAVSDALLILNPDAMPAPSAIARLLTSLRGPGVGIAEGRQVPFEHPKAFDTRLGDTSWASGACMMIHRHAFESIRGFDTEFFFLHGDDVDLSWRLRLAGFRVVHVPSAAFFHDKKPDETGRPQTTYPERYHQALSRLLLLSRYGDQQFLDESLTIFDRGDPPQRHAAAAFFSMREADAIPRPLPGGHRVAQFEGGEYAVHRF